MKKYLCLLLFTLFFELCLFSQPKEDLNRDRVWVFSRESLSHPTPNQNAYKLIFEKDSVRIEVDSFSISTFYGVSSISDRLGNLLFYSNGCSIHDNSNNIISGGEHLNEGYYLDDHCLDKGIWLPKAIVTLPINDSTFILLYQRLYDGEGNNHIVTDRLYSAKVIINSSGILNVIEQDRILLDGRIIIGGNMAVGRHANGKDWWVLLSEEDTNNKFKFLLTENEFLLKEQRIGENLTRYDSGSGSTLFSPDGKKMVSYNVHSDIHIFDFDRCSGELSNSIQIPIKDEADQVLAAGAAISPNSRFLYLPSTQYIYQFDLWASDIEKSRIVVAEYDGFTVLGGFTTRFFQAQLGPDGKIYIGTPSNRDVFHVIEYPNEKGLACRVIQHKIVLPSGIYAYTAGLPNHPNFRLGPQKGSICDTLGMPSWISITSQPYTQSVCSGASTYFDLTAEGYPLTYQWQVNKGNSWEQVIPDTIFIGTKDSRLEILKTDTSMNNWKFRCVLDTGVEKDTSKIVTLNVSSLPAIISDVELRVNEDTIWFENRSQNFNTFKWFLGDDRIDSTSNSFMKVYDPPTHQHTYQIDLVMENECSTEYFTEVVAMDIPRVTADFIVDTLIICGFPRYVVYKHASPNQHRVVGGRKWLPGRFSDSSPSFPDSTRIRVGYTRVWRHYDHGLIVCDKITCDTVQMDSLFFVPGSPNLSAWSNHIEGRKFEFASRSGASADTIVWYLEDGTIISEEPNFIYDFKEDGIYKVFVDASNSCYLVEDSLEIIVDSLLTSSINILDSEISDQLIPNPIHSTAQVVSDSPFGRALEIYSISGNLIFRKESVYDGQTINLENLTSGIYFYKFIDKESGVAAVRKFIKI